MKKKIIVMILISLMYIIFTLYSSCTQGSAQSSKELINYHQDTTEINFDSILIFDVQKDAIIINYLDINREKYINEKIIFKSKVKQVEMDTTWKMGKDSSYKQLEKTELILKSQNKTIDSILLRNKKKEIEHH